MVLFDTGQKRKALVLAFSSFAAIGINSGLLGVAWPSIRGEFGLALDAVAALLVASTIGFTAGSVLAGQVMGRMGLLLFLAVANLIASVGLFTQAATPTWWLMATAALLGGWGSGTIDTGSNIYVAGNHSVRTMNWMHASFGLGATLGPLIVTGLLGLNLTWRYAYVLVGLIHLALAGAALLMSRSFRIANIDRPAEPATNAINILSRAPVSATLRLPVVWLGILLFFLYTGVEASAGQWTFTLFTESRGVSPYAAGILTSVFWAMLTLGRIVLGAGAQRIGIERLLRLSMIGTVLASALIVFRSPALAFAGVGLMGLALSAIFPTLQADTPHRIGLAHAATMIGYQTGSAAIGFAALPALAGVLGEEVGLESIAVFLLASSVVMLVVNEVAVLAARRMGASLIE
jgi:fucose permease